MSEPRSTLAERVHRAVARVRAAGGSDWDITEAACAEIAKHLREEQALWRAKQGGRTFSSGDEAFDSAVSQCADQIDPEAWRYLREV